MLISILLNRKRINIHFLTEWPQPSPSLRGGQWLTVAFQEPGLLGPFLQHPHSHMRTQFKPNTLAQLTHSKILYCIVPAVL